MLKKERETVQKIAARAYTQEYLSGLLATVLTSLRTSEYFNDPVERGLSSFSRHQMCHFNILISILLFFLLLYL